MLVAAGQEESFKRERSDDKKGQGQAGGGRGIIHVMNKNDNQTNI